MPGIGKKWPWAGPRRGLISTNPGADRLSQSSHASARAPAVLAPPQLLQPDQHSSQRDMCSGPAGRRGKQPWSEPSQHRRGCCREDRWTTGRGYDYECELLHSVTNVWEIELLLCYLETKTYYAPGIPLGFEHPFSTPIISITCNSRVSIPQWTTTMCQYHVKVNKVSTLTEFHSIIRGRTSAQEKKEGGGESWGKWLLFLCQVDRKSLWVKMTFEQRPEGNEETCATFFHWWKETNEGGLRFSVTQCQAWAKCFTSHLSFPNYFERRAL